MRAALIVAVLQGAGGGTEIPMDMSNLVADSAAMATAYADAETRNLVRLAREQRGLFDESVFRYQAVVRTRLSVAMRALARDRLVFRREAAARVDWRRDGVTDVHMLGGRQAFPIAVPGLQVAEDLEDGIDFIPDPADNRLMTSPDGNDFAWHPLIKGGEAVYRYGIGDTTEIRLPDGQAIRLAELRVTPRTRDIRLITGSFWVELRNHSIVQAVFRPSRDFDLERDLPGMEEDAEEDLDDIPGLLKPIRFDMRYITMEYGLWEMRWWMPRLIAFEGHFQVGPGRFPIRFEITYSDYEIEADRYGLPSLPPVIRQLAGDPYSKPRPYRFGRRVTVADTAKLLTSEFLPESFYGEGVILISEAEIRELGRRLGSLPPVPWEASRPRLTWPWTGRGGLLRYNRVEGLSAGARIVWDLGRAGVDAVARVGTERVPGAELGLEVPTLHRTWRVAGYHRLAAVDPAQRPFGAGNSLSALLLGRDDGQYFRASGGEAEVAPEGGAYRLRLFTERQTAVERNTDFSVAHLLDRSHTFRPNLQAEPATQVGARIGAAVHRGLNPNGFRWGAGVDVAAEAGDYRFVRPGFTLRAGAPLPGPLVAGMEVGAGTSAGQLPRQSLWYVGGPASVRGFPGGFTAGTEYARARLEVATEFPGARLVVFSDGGWAGPLRDLDPETALWSAGVGASLLDGLVRLDLARAIQPITDWRLDLYLDGLF